MAHEKTSHTLSALEMVVLNKADHLIVSVRVVLDELAKQQMTTM